MTERMLQFIWQFQHYNAGELSTASGEAIQIIFPGHYNTNQGPDFSDARIMIGKTKWAGAIELHIKTSDWDKHHHQTDKNYDNVILHVVWENDAAINNIPVLELKGRVAKILLERYEELMRSTSLFIPCGKNIATIRNITWKSWKDRLLAERLLRKAKVAGSYLEQNTFHWEETFWWLLARNFGMKVNADAFEAIARSVPLTVLAKQKFQLHQLEALLFGQAGELAGDFLEKYPQMLQREYRYQQQKYGLTPASIPLLFLRMRPGNFPTIRLAQLAMLVYTSAHLFSKIKEAGSLNEVRQWFNVTANDYWHYHYRFDELTTFMEKRVGVSMINNIIINTIVPLLFAYGNYCDNETYKDKALRWLEETIAEQNTIIRGFNNLGIKCDNAFDSQALIELKTQYCDKKRCLDCGVGNSILKK